MTTAWLCVSVAAPRNDGVVRNRALRKCLDQEAATTSLALLVVALLVGAANAQTSPVADPAASRIPPARDRYMGRQIAQTMHYSGAEWLVRNTREREERCSRMLANMGIEPGMTVCDLGCGNGFHTLKMAPLVGPRGRILAVDIQPEMLAMLRARMESEGVENITPILASAHDPRLPQQSVDLILLVDVYHEFSHPEYMLRAMHAALKPNGRIVLVEYRAEDASVPIKPLHKMSKRQIMREFPANGFRLVGQFDRLPWQHMLLFAKAVDRQ
jgi:2-polyprenyl-3-methyl-5-hydroxy-6-metoxy-1,4-benzoquinol methylase